MEYAELVEKVENLYQWVQVFKITTIILVVAIVVQWIRRSRIIYLRDDK